MVVSHRKWPSSTAPTTLADSWNNEPAWARTPSKAYLHITRGELEAALTSAHARGPKITGQEPRARLQNVMADAGADVGVPGESASATRPRSALDVR